MDTIEDKKEALLVAAKEFLSRKYENFHAVMEVEEKAKPEEDIFTLTIDNELMLGTCSFYGQFSEKSQTYILYSTPKSKRFAVGNITYKPFNINQKEELRAIAFHMVMGAMNNMVKAPQFIKGQPILARSSLHP